VLGALYRAGQLTAEQEAELAALDHELIQHLDEPNLSYGLDLQSVAQLFTWSTPLALCNSVLHRAGPIRRGFVVSLWAEPFGLSLRPKAQPNDHPHPDSSPHPERDRPGAGCHRYP